MWGFAKKELTSLELQGGFIDCVIWDARKALNNKTWVLPDFSTKNTEIIKLEGAQFILLYHTTKQRDEAAQLFKDNFKEKGLYFSEPLPDGAQVARVIWPFEYNGYIGILVECYNAYDESMTNPERWLYEGIVLDPVIYFWESKSLQSEMNNRVDSVIHKPGN